MIYILHRCLGDLKATSPFRVSHGAIVWRIIRLPSELGYIATYGQ